jgi:hypothetical protein
MSDKPTWCPSHREEVLSALYLIAGLLAYQIDFRRLATILFFKAAADTICALKCVHGELKQMQKDGEL